MSVTYGEPIWVSDGFSWLDNRQPPYKKSVKSYSLSQERLEMFELSLLYCTATYDIILQHT